MVDLRTMSIKPIIHALIDATMEDRVKWEYDDFHNFSIITNGIYVRVSKFSIRFIEYDTRMPMLIPITKKIQHILPFSEERKDFKELRYFIKLQHTNEKRKQKAIFDTKIQDSLSELMNKI